jgi:hypothetical protein
MILEAAQLINTNLWVDHLFGFVPRPITKEENKILQTTRKEQKELAMEDRIFPYLPTMQNHPSMGTFFIRELLLDKLLCFCSW